MPVHLCRVQPTCASQCSAVPCEPTATIVPSEKPHDAKIARAVTKVFGFKPADIVSQLGLLRPIYRATTNYGHFGKAGLPWEHTNKVAALKAAVK